MNKTVQLFMLPFAGGNSMSFMKLTRFLHPAIECIPVEYAGRGSRSDEPLIDKYDDFLKDVLLYIQERKNDELPYAVLGYSMGCALTLDIATYKYLSTNPVYCFFCAEGALNKHSSARNYGLLPNDQFTEKIIDMGGIDKRILDDQDEVSRIIEIIKNDYGILSQFIYSNQKVQCESSIIYSPSDLTCVDMEEWVSLIQGRATVYKLDGGHFFVKTKYRDLARIINSELAEYI